MTTATPETLLTYSDILAWQRTSALRTSEIPAEHQTSLPLPTRRGDTPGFAFFAAPTSNVLVQPLAVGPPDRWWIVDARSGHLSLYALCRVTPLAAETPLERATLPAEERTVAEVRAAAEAIRQQMDALAPAFFTGVAGDAPARDALRDALEAHLRAPVMPFYHALAPDFFAWLDA